MNDMICREGEGEKKVQDIRIDYKKGSKEFRSRVLISCVWVIVRGEYILDYIILFYIGRYLEFETGLSICNSF